MSSNILWEGKVAVKNSLFVKNVYAVISNDRLEVRKSSKPDSQILFSIDKAQIKSITVGKGDFAEIFWKGYRGFEVTFQRSSAEKVEKFNFWPNSFGAYANTSEIVPFSHALSDLFPAFDGKNVAEGQAKSATNLIIIMAVLLPSIFICGALPALFIVGGVSGAMSLWNYEKMDVNLRKVLAIGSIILGVLIAFVINVIAGFAIVGSRNY